MQELPHTHGCFVCGESNPAGLKLRFHSDGKEVTTRFTPGIHHAGFRDTVHGGLLSTLLDEIMVWACAVQTRRFGYCAELNVRFLYPANPGNELVALARLVANKRDRLYEAEGEIRCGEILLATATGKYIPMKNLTLQDMVGDFIGDPAWLNLK